MRVTMEDIARMAGVSKATVSRVVNGIEQGVGPETRRRVLQIVKETNYRSYSLPSQNQSKTLGLIIPDIINPFFGIDASPIVKYRRSIGCLPRSKNSSCASQTTKASSMLNELPG